MFETARVRTKHLCFMCTDSHSTTLVPLSSLCNDQFFFSFFPPLFQFFPTCVFNLVLLSRFQLFVVFLLSLGFNEIHFFQMDTVGLDGLGTTFTLDQEKIVHFSTYFKLVEDRRWDVCCRNALKGAKVIEDKYKGVYTVKLRTRMTLTVSM